MSRWGDGRDSGLIFGLMAMSPVISQELFSDSLAEFDVASPRLVLNEGQLGVLLVWDLRFGQNLEGPLRHRLQDLLIGGLTNRRVRGEEMPGRTPH